MVKRLTAVFCFLWCVFLVHFAFAQWNEGRDGREVFEVFAELGLEDTGVYLEMTGELGRLATERKALDRLRETAKTLGLPEEMMIVEERKNNGTIWSAEGISRLPGLADRYRILVKLIAVEDGFFVRYYLNVSASGNADIGQTDIIRSKMEQIRERENLECLIGMRLEGRWNRILSEDEKEKICEAVLAQIGTQMTEMSSEGNIMMAYGYKDEFGETVMTGQQRVNLNLVLRDGENGTWCFAGIPAVWSDDVMLEK